MKNHEKIRSLIANPLQISAGLLNLDYYLDTRSKSKTNTYPLKLRIGQKEKSIFINTKIKINPAYWDYDNRFILGENNQKLNQALAYYFKSSESILLNLQLSGDIYSYSLNELKDIIKDKVFKDPIKNNKESKNLFLNHIILYKETKEGGGAKVFSNTIEILKSFDKYIESRTFEEITDNYIRMFEKWCIDKKGLKINTIGHHLRNIRTVFNFARRNGVTKEYPFLTYRIKKEKTKKRNLTIEQLREIKDYKNLETWQVEYRDIFMLMFYLIGVNAVDLFNAKKVDYSNGRLNYKRAKTKKEYSILVPDEAKEIIEKYKGQGEYLLSVLDRYSDYKDYLSHLNNGIKAIGRTLGKQGKVIKEGKFKEVTSYWTRHTWATIAYKLGINIDVIAQALGHSQKSQEVTMIYIEQDYKKVDEANKKVIDYLFNRNKEDKQVILSDEEQNNLALLLAKLKQ